MRSLRVCSEIPLFHPITTCTIFLLLISAAESIRFAIPHPLNENVKFNLPLTLKIEAIPNLRRNTSAITLRNSSDLQLEMPEPNLYRYNISTDVKKQIISEIPLSILLPEDDTTTAGEGQPASTKTSDDLYGQFDSDADDAMPLLNVSLPISIRVTASAADSSLNRTHDSVTVTGDKPVRGKAPFAVAEAAGKLFTYALGLNLTANRGKRPLCECGRRRLEGMYPLHVFNTRKVDGNIERVAGGSETIPNEFPWRVALQGGSNEVFCGGSIIDNGWILTAAHCLADMDPTSVVYVNAGDHDVSTVTETDNVVIKADGWILHPQYDRMTADNDIALIRLQRDLVFRDNIQPICLPYKLVDDDLIGATAVIGGWGSPAEGESDSRVLRHVYLPVLSAHQCRDLTKQLITDNMLGTMMTGRDPCRGDLGGTLDFFDLESGRYQAIGIASHGEGCGRVNSPRLYTKVTNYIDFIQGITKSAFCVK